MRPIAIIAVIAALAAGAAWYHYGSSQTAQTGAAPAGKPGMAGPAKPSDAKKGAPAGGPPGGFAMPVEAVAADAGRLERSILAIGTLRSNQSIVVRPEIAGRVARIDFKEGQPVAAGQRLVALEDSVARAELAQAKASLVLSKANYERALELARRGAGTARARDEALAKLRNDEAAVALSAAKLDKTTISAPFKGIIGLRKIDLGDFLNVGQDIANLEDVDPMKVDFRVPETFLAAVRTGQQIAVTVDAWPGRSFPGEVYAIDPMIDEKGRSIVIRARIANPDSVLRPGLFVRVRLILTVSENAVMIPEEALVPVGDAHYVFRVLDGKAVYTRVEIGQRHEGKVQVLKGVEPGTLVVTAGQIKLRDGLPVAVMPTGDGKPGGGPADTEPGGAPAIVKPGGAPANTKPRGASTPAAGASSG